MGRPVIATAVPGCKDVVDDGETGLLCRARDAADLEAKMEEMEQQDLAAWRRMGDAGRAKMASSFDERYVIAHYRKVIRALV
ncbi:D-inositol-3-phosphate glycosyltransferase [compost metagenome]